MTNKNNIHNTSKFRNTDMCFVSMRHITKDDAALLTKIIEDERTDLLAVYPKGGDFFIFVDDVDFEGKRGSELSAYGISRAFILVLQKARNEGWLWMLLDREERPIDGLPVFDW